MASMFVIVGKDYGNMDNIPCGVFASREEADEAIAKFDWAEWGDDSYFFVLEIYEAPVGRICSGDNSRVHRVDNPNRY